LGTSGVIIEPLLLNLFEGGSPTAYSLRLQTQPASTVTVTILGQGALLLDKTSATFNATTWNIPQVVTVEAPDDGFTEGVRVITIRHSLSSTDSEYNNVGADNVTVYLTDEGVLFLPLVNRK
jgi:hypothetical protein